MRFEYLVRGFQVLVRRRFSAMAFILLCVAAPQASALIIGEFRVRGPNGANDQFIKLYNEPASPLTVVATGTGTGYGVAASDGTLRCSVPNGTVIPAHGHYLCVNSVAYSIGAQVVPVGRDDGADGHYLCVNSVAYSIGAQVV